MEVSHKEGSTLIMLCLHVGLLMSLLLVTTKCDTLHGTIERATKQQILATIPPNTVTTGAAASPASHLFLASPSGKFDAYFLRRETAPGAGGYGNDFCYVQVQESGHSVWESECTPVSNANACTLVFSDAGLEIFDGSNSAWDTNADGDDLETLELVDDGDMRIRDKDGNVAWKASDDPLSNQECGTLGAPGMGYAHAPFAHPIGGQKQVFGQPAADQNPAPVIGFRQHLPESGLVPGQGLDQPVAAGGLEQPLVDNNPFDSGSPKGVPKLGIGLMGTLVVLAYVALF